MRFDGDDLEELRLLVAGDTEDVCERVNNERHLAVGGSSPQQALVHLREISAREDLRGVI